MYPCAHGSDEKYHPRWRRSTAPPIKALSVKKSIELIFAQLDIFGLLLPWANSCQELLKVAKNWKELWIVYQQFAKIPISCPNLRTDNGILITQAGFQFTPQKVSKSLFFFLHIDSFFLANFENFDQISTQKPISNHFSKFREEPRISDFHWKSRSDRCGVL